MRITTPSPLSTRFTASMISLRHKLGRLRLNRDGFNLFLLTQNVPGLPELVGKAPGSKH
jgi:hypothetical protein